MANKNKRQEEEAVEDIQNPIDESRELEKSQSDAGVFAAEVVTPEPDKTYLILTRENLTLMSSADNNLWLYKHDANLSDCKIPSAFHGEMANNFGMRPFDVVICVAEGQSPILVMVPETK